MNLQYIVNSFYRSVCYRIDSCTIDPGDSWNEFLNVKTVLLTHAHFDHIYGLNELIANTPEARIYTNDAGKGMLLNAKKNMSYYHGTPFVFEQPQQIFVVKDQEEIEIGHGLSAKAIFTPGHNPSCITWVIDNMLFTGDSYIPGIKTVTNLPGGNKEEAIKSEALIKQLSVDKVIYPGHSIE